MGIHKTDNILTTLEAGKNDNFSGTSDILVCLVHHGLSSMNMAAQSPKQTFLNLCLLRMVKKLSRIGVESTNADFYHTFFCTWQKSAI